MEWESKRNESVSLQEKKNDFTRATIKGGKEGVRLYQKERGWGEVFFPAPLERACVTVLFVKDSGQYSLTYFPDWLANIGN